MKAIIIVLFCLFSISFASLTWSVSQVQNGECVPVEFNNCYPCSIGNVTSYYSIDLYDGIVYSYAYTGPECSGYVTYNDNIYADHNCNVAEHYQCYFFYHVSSISYYELTISTEDSIAATFLQNDHNLVQATISHNALTARSASLSGVIVSNDLQNPDAHFRFEKQVSPTSYSSTLGVFQFDEVVNANDFKFQVSVVDIDTPPAVDIASAYIALAPFLSVAITGDTQYDFLYNGEYSFIFKSPELSLEGVNVLNPYFGLFNITFFPEFEVNGQTYDGNIVFQLESGSYPYHTGPCYLSTSEINDQEVDLYFCAFGSTLPSGSFSWSYGSFSLSSIWDDFERKPPTKPDHMAFSLF